MALLLTSNVLSKDKVSKVGAVVFTDSNTAISFTASG